MHTQKYVSSKNVYILRAITTRSRMQIAVDEAERLCIYGGVKALDISGELQVI